MFDHPLPVLASTDYFDLGVEPYATFEEIRDAKTEALTRLSAERVALERQIKEAESKVTGIVDARQAVKDALPLANESPRVVEEARRKLALLESETMKHTPDYREKRQRMAELDNEEIRINQIMLDTPAPRREYDAAHPPLGLLRLEDAVQDRFAEGRTALGLIRRDLSRHFAASGEDVFHPSDLFREDFHADYAWNPLLDRV